MAAGRYEVDNSNAGKNYAEDDVLTIPFATLHRERGAISAFVYDGLTSFFSYSPFVTQIFAGNDTRKVFKLPRSDFNNDIVNSLNKEKVLAVSINTKNNNVIEIIPEDEELGYVGIPNKINTNIIDNIVNKNLIPIISPLGLGKNNLTYNINGDIAAGAIAKSLKSRRLLLMTNVEGVLNKEKKLIEEISSSEILEMIKNETITGGMIPKINTCLDAVNNGVTGVVIVDGRKPHSILFELFSDKGAGTLIRK